MKKLLTLTLAVLMTVLLLSCGTSLADELVTYINDDMPAILSLEEQMTASFDSITGDNFTNDADMYTEIAEVTLPAVTEMNTLATAIVPENKELNAVHSLLCEYTAKYMEGYAALLTALEAQDEAMVESANVALEEAAALSVTYYDDLYNLAVNNGIAFNE